MTQTIHGTVQGRNILLDEPLGLPAGQEVNVIVTPVVRERPRGDGIRRSAGALADSWSDEDDRILTEIHQDRKAAGRPEVPE